MLIEPSSLKPNDLQVIYEIREIAGEDIEEPQFIETLWLTGEELEIVVDSDNFGDIGSHLIRVRMTFKNYEELKQIFIDSLFTLKIVVPPPPDLVPPNALPYFEPPPPPDLNLELCSGSNTLWFYNLPEVFDSNEGDSLTRSVDLLDSLAFLVYDEDRSRLIQMSTPEIGNYTVALIAEDSAGGLSKTEVNIQVTCNVNLSFLSYEDSEWMTDIKVTDESPVPFISKIWSNGTVEVEFS